MSDLFDDKNISPMLLYETQPFDDEDYIYELKLDGIRCIYLGDGKVVLQNKRYKDVTLLYPELHEMHRCVRRRAVLDGELVVLQDGKPDFYALQKRSLMGNAFRISLAAKSNPVQFVAYDILYCNGKELTDFPLIERNKYLSERVTEGYKRRNCNAAAKCTWAFPDVIFPVLPLGDDPLQTLAFCKLKERRPLPFALSPFQTG